MVIGLGADELRDLATFIDSLEEEKDKYGPELLGSPSVRLAGQEFGVSLKYDRRGDGSYEVFVTRDMPTSDYILNRVEETS